MRGEHEKAWLREMRGYVSGIIPLLAAQSCEHAPRRPALLVSDTVVINDVRPVRLPLRMTGAAGQAIERTNLRYSAIAYYPQKVHSAQSLTGTLAVWRLDNP